jgi:hypothetical protein
MGCGYYLEQTHPRHVAEQSADELAADLVSEIEEGEIRPGVIGEIGTGPDWSAAEEKVLRAAARAQRQTGLALTIHLHPWSQQGARVLDLLDDEGVAPTKTILNHLTRRLPTTPTSSGCSTVVRSWRTTSSASTTPCSDSAGTRRATSTSHAPSPRSLGAATCRKSWSRRTSGCARGCGRRVPILRSVARGCTNSISLGSHTRSESRRRAYPRPSRPSLRQQAYRFRYIELTPDDLREIESAQIEAQGARYSEANQRA